MSLNPDLPPDTNPYKDMFEYPEKEMALVLSDLLGVEVHISQTSNYELKKSSFSCVSRLDYDMVFDLTTCDVQQIFDNCELNFTSDTFQRRVCSDITIAQAIFSQLNNEEKANSLFDFDIRNVFEHFPGLITMGISGKEILDFFSERGQYPIVTSDFLTGIASGRLEYKLSFACKAMNIKNVHKFRNEVAMYALFYERGITTFCAYEGVLENLDKELCYDLTLWQKNMFLHVHNRAIFSATSDTLEKTNEALLLMHERFFHGDLHFYNVATAEDLEEFKENVLLFDLVNSGVIKSSANLGEAILPDVIVYLGSLTSSFNLLFEEGAISISDAIHTIEIMKNYKKELENICRNQPNQGYRKDRNAIKILHDEVDAFIENVRYFIKETK